LIPTQHANERNQFRTKEAIMPRQVYLLHFDRPLAHARHYIGSTDDLERRLHEHEQGNGARLMAAVARAGIPWRLARTKSWPQLLPGDRVWERRLKRYKKSRRLCPFCSAGAHGRMQKP
jgi:predicted GIY-YIG superfamily endonuclease